MQPLASKTELGQPLGDEHLLLDDNKYIADVVYELRASKQKDFTTSKLLFKKRMFRETDETITEPQFVNLSYVQAQHDYLQVSCLWVWPTLQTFESHPLRIHLAAGCKTFRDAFQGARRQQISSVLEGCPSSKHMRLKAWCIDL